MSAVKRCACILHSALSCQRELYHPPSIVLIEEHKTTSSWQYIPSFRTVCSRGHPHVFCCGKRVLYCYLYRPVLPYSSLSRHVQVIISLLIEYAARESLQIEINGFDMKVSSIVP